MSEVGYERASPRPWKIYTTSTGAPGNWKNVGGSPNSVNAVSFGFVATAILISLFLIMAILEHLFRPTVDSSSSSSSSLSDHGSNLESADNASKLRVHQQTETTPYACGVSVVMPGEKYPTCIAKPAPLQCPREGIHWSSKQQHSFNFSLPS